MTKKPGPRDTGRPDVELGKKLRLLRVARSMSQAEVAERLGVSFQQVQKYEKGVNRVSSARLQEIAAILKVPITDFYVTPNKSVEFESIFRDNDVATLRMLRTYNRIESQNTRHQLVLMIEALAAEYD